MTVTEAPFMREFMRMADNACQKDWHERNGGNLSYRLSEKDAGSIMEFLGHDEEWKNIGLSVPEIADEYFLITGAGKYLRNMPLSPETNTGIIHIDKSGERYALLWGLEGGGRPTSELPTHLLSHAIRKRKTNGAHRVIYHAHPPNMIALSQILPLTDHAITRELWGMITECPLVFPEGVGVVPWMVPGGSEIALATGKLMEKRSVILWAHHGVLCSGTDFDDALGLMETVEKAAEISLKVRSAGGASNTITAEQFIKMGKESGVWINEEFLK